MKKIYKLLLLALITSVTFSATATNNMIMVENIQFVPADLTVNVGDTVTWMWMNGTHTTSSLVIPAGAASWSQSMTSASPVFVYVVTVAGDYNYQCNIHGSMGMTAHFSALPSSGIIVTEAPEKMNVFFSPSLQAINVTYSVNNSSPTTIRISDITGKCVRNLEIAVQNSGVYNEAIERNDMISGVYIVELYTNGKKYSKRVIVE